MLIKSSFFELKNFYNLAHQGDNLTAGIEIDCADIAEDGDTAAVLIRGVDGSSYPALSTFEDKQLRYSFTSADLKYPGNIYFQAAIYGADGKIKHSKVAALHISKSIAGDDEPPEAFKAWLDEAVTVLEELKHSGGGGGAADWSHLREKPFETIGDGLKVEGGALKTDIPESLPNPNALTFTGVVSGVYDGSEPLTVNIPQGGGGGETALEYIDTVTIAEDVTEFHYELPAEFRLLDVYVSQNDVTTKYTGSFRLSTSLTRESKPFIIQSGQNLSASSCNARATFVNATESFECSISTENSMNNVTSYPEYRKQYLIRGENPRADNVNAITNFRWFHMTAGTFKEGVKIFIRGIRA